METLDKDSSGGHIGSMRAVTIKHAKAHLNELVDAATRGEQIVLMRGSTHVATIVPISDQDLDLAPRLSDDQAARLWRSLAEERQAGKVQAFASVELGVRRLARTGARRASATRSVGGK
jgi:prevent-host-death family protein